MSKRIDAHEEITNRIILGVEHGAGEFKLPGHRPAGSITRPTDTQSKSKPAVRKGSPKTKARKRTPSKVTTAKLVWRDVTARVRHKPDYISKGSSHIELVVERPNGAPLPITETGYLSHFLDAEILAAAGGPVRFFLDWIERESRSRKWHDLDFRSRQGDLFKCAGSK